LLVWDWEVRWVVMRANDMAVRVYKNTKSCDAGWELQPIMSGAVCSDINVYGSIRVKVKVDG
jgi:hypothetical protein